MRGGLSVAGRAHLPGYFAARQLWMARQCPALLAERSYPSTSLIDGLATEQTLVEVDCIAQPAVTT